MVCPAANMTPTIVRQVNRTNARSATNVKNVDTWNKLTQEERVREIIGCAMVVAVVVAIILAF